MFRYAIVASMVALCGCVPLYTAPKAGIPSATLNVSRVEHRVMYGGAQMFGIYDNVACQKTSDGTGRVVGLGAFSDQAAVRQIEAGRSLYFRAHTIGAGGVRADTSGQMVQGMSVCVSVVKFAPRAGGVYDVTHVETRNGCALQIIDVATKLPPVDLIEVEVEDSYRK